MMFSRRSKGQQGILLIDWLGRVVIAARAMTSLFAIDCCPVMHKVAFDTLLNRPGSIKHHL